MSDPFLFCKTWACLWVALQAQPRDMSRGRYRQDRGMAPSANGGAPGGFQAHKIEEEIENFVENFKRNHPTQPLDRDAISLESGESSGLQSSLGSTDEYTDDSPEEFPSHRYLLRAFAARNRKYSSTTNTSTRTSVSPASSRSVDCGSESWIDQDGELMLCLSLPSIPLCRVDEEFLLVWV